MPLKKNVNWNGKPKGIYRCFKVESEAINERTVLRDASLGDKNRKFSFAVRLKAFCLKK